MANKPKINLALVSETPENPIRGTVYMSPDSAEGFLKVGIDNDKIETIFDSSDYIRKDESVWMHGEGENSAVLINSDSLATGIKAVAHGSDVWAKGNFSHAEGQGTYDYSITINSRGKDIYYTEDIPASNIYVGYVIKYGNVTTVITSLTAEKEGIIFTTEVSLSDEPLYDATGYLLSAGVASGVASHVEGSGTVAIGRNSHAEGYGTYASGSFSHAEGENTIAYSYASHTEGYNTLVADGADNSHAEGDHTQIYSINSHAEGSSTTALGPTSHVEGFGYTVTATINGDMGSKIYNTDSSISLDSIKKGDIVRYVPTSKSYASFPYERDIATPIFAYIEDITYNNKYIYLSLNKTLDSTHPLRDVDVDIISGVSYGSNSHSEGERTSTIGISSHAEGINTATFGNGSHAEGNSTVADGSNSHAEGYTVTASGIGSHAEGYGTDASGNYSHAEGDRTTASGNYSHAEGLYTNALGEYSHAEGDSTNALGDYSHAEGDGTTASGINSHAEGNSTDASGNYSHAEGLYTNASGNYSHAEGDGTTAIGDFSHAEGDGTTASGQYSHAEGDSTNALGDYSHAEGNGTNASGNYSHAEGYCTRALRQYSHAEGNNTVADGSNSHAEGYNTVADSSNSHAEGNNTIASGDGAHAEGNDTTAIGEYSHTEGTRTVAYGENSHAEGRSYKYSSVDANATINGAANTTTYTVLFPTSSFWEPLRKNAIILYANKMAKIIRITYDSNIATVLLDKTLSSTDLINADFYIIGGTSVGNHSHTEGVNTMTSGTGSHAEGINTTAIGNYSHTEGTFTNTTGDYSHAEGDHTTATGDYSHAEGVNTAADGSISHAEGYNTIASGDGAHAEGNDTTAVGEYSHAEGLGVIATNSYEHAQGTYNISRDYTLFSIGIGTENTARANIIEVNDNSLYIKDVGNFDGSTLDASTRSAAQVFNFSPLQDVYYDYIFNGGDMPVPTKTLKLIYVDDYPDGISTYSQDAGYESEEEYIAACIENPFEHKVNVCKYINDAEVDGVIHEIYALYTDEHEFNRNGTPEGYCVLKTDSSAFMIANSLETNIQNEYCPFISVTFTDNNVYEDESDHFTLLALREISIPDV